VDESKASKRKDWEGYKKNRSRVETQPRFKIQYPMKNRCKDAVKFSKQGIISKKYF
jgi:hypothetical protein